MVNSTPLTVLYLVPDLTDAAVERRVNMVKAGGATVNVMGFTRKASLSAPLTSSETVIMGRTYNGRFILRIFAVLKVLFFAPRYFKSFLAADVILARNLEMLAIAVVCRLLSQSRAIIIYEVLDIHRLLLGNGVFNRVLRRLETILGRNISAIITSSPAFIAHYLRQQFSARCTPMRLVENKVLELDRPSAVSLEVDNVPNDEWVIGWFGILRCQKSLSILRELVQKNPGCVRVVMRGRPALDQIPAFHSIVEETPGLEFLGAYRSPPDLPDIYAGIHFVWAVDMYEEGLNSAWLLPNRLYEGGNYGKVPIALADVETGSFLKDHGIGALLDHPLECSLQSFIKRLTPDGYSRLSQAVRNCPRSTFTFDLNDCIELVSFFSSFLPSPSESID